MKRLLPNGIEEVEEPDIVRTGIRTVAGADAAVIDLRIQPFFIMVTRIRRADRLTWRMITLLAEYGSELYLNIREFTFPIALDPDPVHRASARRFRRPHRRYVVFSVACRHTGFAARASVQVHRHS